MHIPCNICLQLFLIFFFPGAYTKALGFTLNQIQNTRMTRNDAEMECQNRKLTTLMTFTSAPMMTLLQTEIARNLILGNF